MATDTPTNSAEGTVLDKTLSHNPTNKPHGAPQHETATERLQNYRAWHPSSVPGDGGDKLAEDMDKRSGRA